MWLRVAWWILLTRPAALLTVPLMKIATVNCLSPAKINLHLRVGPARADGFHPLLTWMVTVWLFDKLRIEPSDVDGFTCSDSSLPTDGRNLVVRAIQLLRETRDVPQLAIHLEKHIPSGGGLGGGSSDAATVLMALDRMYPTQAGPDAAALLPLAARLGSDVPFFLFGSSSICRGRGEIITPVEPPRRVHWALLMLPNLAVPTAAAYQKFDELQMGDDMAVATDPNITGWVNLPTEQLLAKLVNDLERPAFVLVPELGKLRESLQNQLGQVIRMSGSGSSLFTLYDDEKDAQAAAGRVRGTSPGLIARAVPLGAM